MEFLWIFRCEYEFTPSGRFYNLFLHSIIHSSWRKLYRSFFPEDFIFYFFVAQAFFQVVAVLDIPQKHFCFHLGAF